MRRTPPWKSLAGAALALALCPALAPAAPAPAGPAPDKDAPANPVETLRKALDKPISLKFDKTPFPAALDKLRDAAGIKLALDVTTIQQMGITPDQLPPVDGDFKDVKVRAILRTLLEPANLSYAPVGDAVIVTTEDNAVYRQLHQHISVDMDQVEFAVALRQIAKGTGVNLIMDSRVEKQAAAKVSLRLEDVPLDTAVRLLAEMASLKPVRIGNTLFVTSKENANELRNDPDIAQPNANAQRQAELQQQLQIQLGAQAGLGGIAVPGGPGGPPAIAAPPGVAPAVPPADVQKKTDKDAPDDKPKDPPPADPSK